MKVGIVGGIEERWKPEEIELAGEFIIAGLLRYIRNGIHPIVVSGDSPKGGIDKRAKSAAQQLGLEYEGHPPEVNQWEDWVGAKNAFYTQFGTYGIHPWSTCTHGGAIHSLKGYKSRNLQIAQTIPLPPEGVLWCFEPARLMSFPSEVGVESILGTSWSRGGGRFTATEAKKLGKKVFVIEVGEL